MQIKIEIDVRPEELRRFLGLPDVAGLQEDVIHFLRTKVGQASENFDASAFVKGNIDLLSRNATLRKLLSAVKHTEGATKGEPPNPQGKPAKAARKAEQKAAAEVKAKVRENRRVADDANKAAATGKARTKRPLVASTPVADTKNQPSKPATKRVPMPKVARQGSELGADLSAAVSMAEDALKRGGNRLKMAALKGIPKGLPASAMKIAGKASSKVAETQFAADHSGRKGAANSPAAPHTNTPRAATEEQQK